MSVDRNSIIYDILIDPFGDLIGAVLMQGQATILAGFEHDLRTNVIPHTSFI